MKKVGAFVLFCIMVLFAAGILRLLDWLPLVIQDESLRRYASVEDVQRELKIGKILLPSYFPQYLSWPPSEIFAQEKPFPLVLLYFKDLNTGDVVLAIRQSDSKDPAPVPLRIEPKKIASRRNIVVKGRNAELSVAACEDGRTCNAVSWREEGYTITIVARDSIQELLRIASSMLTE